MIDIFFCNSSLFFFGYLTEPTINLHLYSESGKLLFVKNVKELGVHSDITNIKFYKGSMIVGKKNGEIIFLQKKIYSRNYILDLKKVIPST